MATTVRNFIISALVLTMTLTGVATRPTQSTIEADVAALVS